VAKASTAKKKKTSNKATLEQALKTLRAFKEESGEAASICQNSPLAFPLILHGSQMLRAKRAVAWIRKNFYPKQEASAQLYFGPELGNKKSIANIKEVLLAPSLFSKESLLVIYQADSIRNNLAKELAEAILKGRSQCCCILISEDISKKTSLPYFLKKEATHIELKDLVGKDLRRFLEQEAKRGGATGFEDAAAVLLAKKCLGNTEALAAKTAKLALLADLDQKISVDLVERVASDTPETDSASLLKFAARKDLLSCNLIIDRLLETGVHPIQVCYFLSRALRVLLASSSGGPSTTLHKELNNYWIQKQISSAKNAFSRQDLESGIEILKELDFRLKDSCLPNELALQLAAQKLALRSENA